jgi:hypothetical protein
LINRGNARLIPVERVVLSGPFGWGRQEIAVDQSAEILPGDSVERSAAFPGALALGRLTAQVHVQARTAGTWSGPATVEAEGAGECWAIPWAWVAAAIAVLVGAGAGIGVLVSRRRQNNK